MKNSLLFFIKTSFLRKEARCSCGLLYFSFISAGNEENSRVYTHGYLTNAARMK